MNKFVLFFLTCFISIASFASVPGWVRHTPAAENNTYYYVVESATGTTEDAARNKAMGLVLQRAIQYLGSPYTSDQINEAVRTGAVESMSKQYKIPVNKVCSYRQNMKGGGVRVYVLYQVALAGNIDVQFTPFNNCGSHGDDQTEVSMRPEEWGVYEIEDYISASQEAKLERKEKSSDVIPTLIEETKNALISSLGLTDPNLIAFINTKSHYDEGSKTCFAIAYIERDIIVDKYFDYIESEMTIADKQLKDAQSRISANDLVSAKSTLNILEARVDSIDLKLNFIRAYAASSKMDYYSQHCREIIAKCKELSLSVVGNHQIVRENKVREFIRNGERCYEKTQIGDALRYYYGAEVLLADLPNATTMMDTVRTRAGEKIVTVNLYLQQRIKDILSNIEVVCDGYLEDSPSEVKLSFYFKSKGNTVQKAISNLNFRYNINTGWSDLLPVRDGWSIVSIVPSNKPTNIRIKCEYRYANEASFDPELQEKIAQYDFDYDQYCLKTIPFVDKAITPTTVSSPAISGAATDAVYESTAINQNSVVTETTEESHLVSKNQTAYYTAIIEKICAAVDNKDYESVYTCFTSNGYDQFCKLIKYGSARIISRTGYNFVRLGNDIQCRSIPMEFIFKKGERTIENVIFTFDNTKKIDGIQFALEERSARDIMVDNRYSETSKLVLINFMENYKTAFALKRTDYIESIFSNDAVIITGRVLQNTNTDKEFQQVIVDNVVYTRQTKEEYINRLRTSFKGKEWINIKFGNTNVEKSVQGEQYGVRLKQDYMSSNYGDRGNLFLLIDCQDQEHPLIRVRVWQAETGTNEPFSLSDYDQLTNSKK